MPDASTTDQLVADFLARGGRVRRLPAGARAEASATFAVSEVSARISRKGRPLRQLTVVPTDAVPTGRIYAFDPAILAEIDHARSAGDLPGQLTCATRTGHNGQAIITEIHRVTAP